MDTSTTMASSDQAPPSTGPPKSKKRTQSSSSPDKPEDRKIHVIDSMNPSTSTPKLESVQIPHVDTGEKGNEEPRQVIDLTFLPEQSLAAELAFAKGTAVNQTTERVVESPKSVSLLHRSDSSISNSSRKGNHTSPGLPKSNLLTTIVKSLFTADVNAHESISSPLSRGLSQLTVPTVPKLSHNLPSTGSLADLTAITYENNMCLKEMARVILDQNRVLGNIYKSVSENDCQVEEMTERLDHFESHVENLISRLSSSIDQVNKKHESLSTEFTERFEEITDYVDSRVSSITESLPVTFAKMGSEVDRKMVSNTKMIQESLEERLKTISFKNEIDTVCDAKLELFQSKSEFVDRKEMSEMIEKLKITNVDVVTKIVNDCLKTYPSFESVHKICDSRVHALEVSPNLVKKPDLLDLVHNVCDMKLKTFAANPDLIKKSDLLSLEQKLGKVTSPDLSPPEQNTLGNTELAQMKSQISDFTERSEKVYSDFNKRLEDTASMINTLKQDSSPFSGNPLENTVWKSFKQRTERFLDKAPQIEYMVQQNTMGRKNQDLFNRRLNVLIDQMTESETVEDTLAKITEMIDFVFAEEDITPSKIEQTLRDFSPLKSSGCLCISSRLYLDAFEVLAEPLAFILNLSLRSKVFPSMWKCSIVTPIPKKGIDVFWKIPGPYL